MKSMLTRDYTNAASGIPFISYFLRADAFLT
jgi:hypothetical protein